MSNDFDFLKFTRELLDNIPQDVKDKLPNNLSEDIDHYVYGGTMNTLSYEDWEKRIYDAAFDACPVIGSLSDSLEKYEAAKWVKFSDYRPDLNHITLASECGSCWSYVIWNPKTETPEQKEQRAWELARLEFNAVISGGMSSNKAWDAGTNKYKQVMAEAE